MRISIDMSAILAAISEENPEGADIRYSAIYDEIREARRSEEPIAEGEWQREGKNPEWGKVISVSLKSLAEKSKDLQVAIWLTEALTHTEGVEGIRAGMSVLEGLLDRFWESAYPQVDEDDYDYRAAPFEFLNEKISSTVRHIPLTDPRTTAGYSYLKWQESREVANARGEARENLIADGKMPPEEFDSAVAKSSPAFYRSLAEALCAAVEQFESLEKIVDMKFGPHAPGLSKLGTALDECRRLVLKICIEQKGLKEAFGRQAASGGEASEPSEAAEASEHSDSAGLVTDSDTTPAGADQGQDHTPEAPAAASTVAAGAPSAALLQVPNASEAQETRIWNEALRIMQSRGFKPALDLLLAAASSQSSERGRCRYRFLVAKLCLKAGRPELARPIVEQLNTLITELQLEKWECPFWIAEILEALYQCLISGEDRDEEAVRARELFRKICTMDVTRALDTGNEIP